LFQEQNLKMKETFELLKEQTKFNKAEYILNLGCEQDQKIFDYLSLSGLKGIVYVSRNFDRIGDLINSHLESKYGWENEDLLRINDQREDKVERMSFESSFYSYEKNIYHEYYRLYSGNDIDLEVFCDKFEIVDIDLNYPERLSSELQQSPKNEKFDFIIISKLLSHLTRPAASSLISRISKHARPDATVFIRVNGKDYNGFEKKGYSRIEFEKLIAEFEIITPPVTDKEKTPIGPIEHHWALISTKS